MHRTHVLHDPERACPLPASFTAHYVGRSDSTVRAVRQSWLSPAKWRWWVGELRAMLVGMAITDWPSDERPREKLLEKGAAALSDAELLAILLRTGLPGHSAVDLARDILKRFGSLRQLIAADRARFCAGPGMGLARYAELQAVAEISRRQLSESLRSGPLLASPKSTRDYLSARLRDREHEVFCCLYLDKRHRLIEFEELFRGTIDGASVFPREIVKLALQKNAAAVIVAHNHPSGVAEPSQADELITQRVKEALALVDIRLLDHIIVGDGASVSLAERGLL
jgi:DNA repair protein RadC